MQREATTALAPREGSLPSVLYSYIPLSRPRRVLPLVRPLSRQSPLLRLLCFFLSSSLLLSSSRPLAVSFPRRGFFCLSFFHRQRAGAALTIFLFLPASHRSAVFYPRAALYPDFSSSEQLSRASSLAYLSYYSFELLPFFVFVNSSIILGLLSVLFSRANVLLDSLEIFEKERDRSFSLVPTFSRLATM